MIGVRFSGLRFIAKKAGPNFYSGPVFFAYFCKDFFFLILLCAWTIISSSMMFFAAITSSIAATRGKAAVNENTISFLWLMTSTASQTWNPVSISAAITQTLICRNLILVLANAPTWAVNAIIVSSRNGSFS